jgi:hypothetical protein
MRVGTIGTGLFLGIGTAFATSGPVSVLLGYTFTGCAIFGMMQSLGEMSTWLPLPGAIPQYAARYVDPALGFAVGWNNCKSGIIPCASPVPHILNPVQALMRSYSVGRETKIQKKSMNCISTEDVMGPLSRVSNLFQGINVPLPSAPRYLQRQFLYRSGTKMCQ